MQAVSTGLLAPEGTKDILGDEWVRIGQSRYAPLLLSKVSPLRNDGTYDPGTQRKKLAAHVWERPYDPAASTPRKLATLSPQRVPTRHLEGKLVARSVATRGEHGLIL